MTWVTAIQPFTIDVPQTALDDLTRYLREHSGSMSIQSTRPQTLAHGLNDSPDVMIYRLPTRTVPRGGHSAAREQRDLLVDDVRSFFRALR